MGGTERGGPAAPRLAHGRSDPGARSDLARDDRGEFTFLSACKSSLGGVVNADEAITLTSALHFSGWRHVIGTCGRWATGPRRRSPEACIGDWRPMASSFRPEPAALCMRPCATGATPVTTGPDQAAGFGSRTPGREVEARFKRPVRPSAAGSAAPPPARYTPMVNVRAKPSSTGYRTARTAQSSVGHRRGAGGRGGDRVRRVRRWGCAQPSTRSARFTASPAEAQDATVISPARPRSGASSRAGSVAVTSSGSPAVPSTRRCPACRGPRDGRVQPDGGPGVRGDVVVAEALDEFESELVVGCSAIPLGPDRPMCLQTCPLSQLENFSGPS
jgi:hypothetical protein